MDVEVCSCALPSVSRRASAALSTVTRPRRLIEILGNLRTVRPPSPVQCLRPAIFALPCPRSGSQDNGRDGPTRNLPARCLFGSKSLPASLTDLLPAETPCQPVQAGRDS